MKTKISTNPNPSKFTQSMKNIPYSNTAALCDIIDNSLDANATKVHIFITQKNQLFNIKVIDNGIGMDFKTLGQSLIFGSDTYKDGSQLGRFGMGLSTAIHHLCQKATVMSKKDSIVNAAIWDFDHIVKNNINECEIGQADSKELTEFNKYIKFNSGTIITFDKCSGVKHKTIPAFCKALRSEISRKFRDKTKSGIEIYVNREICPIIDPLCLDKSEIEHDFVLQYNDSEIKVKIVSLPKNLKGSIGDKINNLNSEAQGFYVMRNGREIAEAVDLGIYSKKDSLNRFRAQLDFEGNTNIDDLIGLNFTKNGVDLNEDLKNYLSEAITPLLEELEKKYNAHNNNEGENFDYSEIEKIIQNCSLELDFNISKNKRNKNTTDNENTRQKSDKLDNPLKKSNSPQNQNGTQQGKNNSLRVKIKNAAIDGDVIYNYVIENNELIITFNTNHDFYTMLIKDKKITNKIILNVFAEISAQIKVLNEVELENEQILLANAFNRSNTLYSESLTILLNSIKK